MNGVKKIQQCHLCGHRSDLAWKRLENHAYLMCKDAEACLHRVNPRLWPLARRIR